MVRTAPLPPPEPVGEHSLFGLRDASPQACAIAAALTHAYQVQHDLSELGMSEADWARLYALGRR